MTNIQLDRVRRLIAKLREMEGFVEMYSWVDSGPLEHPGVDRYPRRFMQQAMQNPCGTACCLAGKAGLIPEFRAEGFRWLDTGLGFSMPISEFFGLETYAAVFTGSWCKIHIETPQQGAMALEACLEDLRGACQMGYGWRPPEEVQQAIIALRPTVVPEVRFPVSEKWRWENRR